MRTYSGATYREAMSLWESGRFGSEWDKYRRMAAERGFLYPPAGSRFDSFEDEEPSQRAVVYQAIADTPLLLAECIGKSRSWSDVVAKLLRERQVMRDELRLRERDDEWERSHAARIGVPEPIRQLLRRMSDSV